MKISVDGGALNQKNSRRFGTAVFSENLIKSLQIYDDQNKYYIYSFQNLRPKIFWMKIRVSLEEFRMNKDIFLALNQALPIYTSGKIISFCHGLSYYFYPKFYSQKDVSRLNNQLNEMIKKSYKIIVSSKKVKDELELMHHHIETKIIVLPFGIPFDMINEKNKHQRLKIDKKEKYFIFVANNQSIKNVNLILQSFNRLKKDPKFKEYKLLLIGNWKEFENKNQGIISFNNISRNKLKNLYKNATALLTSSYYESFNFPVLEALSQGCPVVGLKSAIIPELISYVNVANNNKEFMELMKKIIIKPSVQSIDQLYKKFNWKNYVNNLVKLY